MGQGRMQVSGKDSSTRHPVDFASVMADRSPEYANPYHNRSTFPDSTSSLL